MLEIPLDSTKTEKLDYLFSIDKLDKHTKSLSPGKATGIDNISNAIIHTFF